MGLLDRFSKQDSSDKEPMLQDRSTILAYLEELARLRSAIQIWLQKDDLLPIQARVELVSEEANQFTISSQRSIPVDLDTRFPREMLFVIDGMRFRSPIRYQGRGGYMQALFQVPDRVFHAERRNKMRARFGQREKAHVTVLEDLFQGTGATGKLVNLSMEGLCMRIERALSIRYDRRLPLSTALFHQAQELMVVRILDIPNIPMLECNGRVCHLAEGPEGVRMGLFLHGLGAQESSFLHEVLSRRLPTFGRGFPVKRRRSEMELPVGAQEQGGSAEETFEESEGAENEENVQQPGDANGPEGTQEHDETENAEKEHERLLRLRKAGKRLLLIQSDDLDRAILAGTLQVDGYRQITEARNYLEAIQAIRTVPPDLILIEPQVGTHTAQAVLEKLRKQTECQDVPVVMVASQPDVRTTLMAKMARVAHVMRDPLNFDGELKGVLVKLLNIE